MSLKKLSAEDRLRLMKFVCTFAWADLEVHDKEKALVRKMVRKHGLDADEAAQVERWLKLPPRAEEVDPATIPHRHREIFLEAAREMIAADGRVDPAEEETYDLFKQLLR